MWLFWESGQPGNKQAAYLLEYSTFLFYTMWNLPTDFILKQSTQLEGMKVTSLVEGQIQTCPSVNFKGDQRLKEGQRDESVDKCAC